MRDENPQETFSLFLSELNKRGIGFVEICSGNATKQIDKPIMALRPSFPDGLVIGNENINKKILNFAIAGGYMHVGTFGKLNINNPDLVKRLARNLPLDTNFDYGTMFYGTEKGYTDFPEYKPTLFDTLDPEIDQIPNWDLKLKNRIGMAAMSRGRCDPVTQIPGDLMVTYYTQRAGNGLILTESTPISLQGNGYPANGALYNDEQAAGWKKIVDAVKR